jgi:NADH-quinone oxidoreductase subunit K
VIPPVDFLILAAIVFLISLLGFLSRRSLIQALMCLELMMASVGLTFVAIGRTLPDGGLNGMIMTAFCIVVGAAEIGLGLVLVVLYFRRHNDATTDHLDILSS